MAYFGKLERPPHGKSPLVAVQAAQNRRRLDSPQEIELGSMPGPPADRRCNQRRLIVAPLPDPPAVKRHGQKNGVRIRPLQMALHEVGKRLGNSRPPAIFELERYLACNLSIGNGGAETVIGRWMRDAGAALRARSAIKLEREAAAFATWLSDEVQLSPAGKAEAVVLRRHGAAAGTSRRQREIDKLFCRGAYGAESDLHCIYLFPSASSGTSPR
jgi:hypothetical protein